MRVRWPFGLVLLAAFPVVAQSSLLTNQIDLIDPDLTPTVVHEFGPGAGCTTAPSGFGAGFYCEDSEMDGGYPWLGVPGGSIDAAGAFYQVAWDLGQNEFRIERLSLTEIEVVARGPDCVSYLNADGRVVYQILRPRRFAIDAANGHYYLAIRSLLRTQSCDSGTIAGEAGIVRSSGLPTIAGVVPEGPPGPPGPPGPAGPAGRDADEARVVLLEQRLASLQTQVAALQAILEEIENLPLIKNLLEKVQQLEQAAP